MTIFTIVYGYSDGYPKWSTTVLCSTEYPNMNNHEFRQMGLDRVSYIRSCGGGEVYYTICEAIRESVK